jgi:Zn2+/Cd2+-exporting ATPase
VLIGTVLALGGFLLFGLPLGDALYRAATLLVVASPCAVVISVPAAVLSALAAAARRGVLFKGGGALEGLAEVDTVAFDKTGTLTRGVMRVLEATPKGVELETLKRLAGALEAASEHPIARAVVAWGRVPGRGMPEVSEARIEPGRGVHGMVEGRRVWAGNRRFAAERGVAVGRDGELAQSLDALEGRGMSVVLVGEGDAAGARLIGYLGVADEVRPHAAAALQGLQRHGVRRLAMLTGDHPAAAHEVARRLGLPREAVFAELLPADKLAQVELLGRDGVVAFVGDGVNDAAGLARARVGIAMGAAGSDVALETADIALLSDDLRRLPEALALARRARRIIRQNLVFALGVMGLMVVATVVGVLPLPLGVIGHEGGTLLVVANGLRLLSGVKRVP